MLFLCPHHEIVNLNGKQCKQLKKQSKNWYFVGRLLLQSYPPSSWSLRCTCVRPYIHIYNSPFLLRWQNWRTQTAILWCKLFISWLMNPFSKLGAVQQSTYLLQWQTILIYVSSHFQIQREWRCEREMVHFCYKRWKILSLYNFLKTAKLISIVYPQYVASTVAARSLTDKIYRCQHMVCKRKAEK